MKIICFFVLLVLFIFPVNSFSQGTSPGWEKLTILQGEWVGKGGGQPGQGAGNFSFQFDLDNKIMVKRSVSEYPASGDKPAIVHKDMMLIYAGAAQETLKAIYFDNEGHSINYLVSFTDGDKTIQFTSEPIEKMPGFRLTYSFSGNDNMTINFEIAAPGSPGNFKSYVKGSATRKK